MRRKVENWLFSSSSSFVRLSQSWLLGSEWQELDNDFSTVACFLSADCLIMQNSKRSVIPMPKRDLIGHGLLGQKTLWLQQRSSKANEFIPPAMHCIF
jgi:hypothetical protein